MAILGRGQPFRPQIKIPVDVVTYVYVPIVQVRPKQWVKRSHSVRSPVVYSISTDYYIPLTVRRVVSSKLYIHKRHPYTPIPSESAYVPVNRIRNITDIQNRTQVRQAPMLPAETIFVPLVKTRQQQTRVWSPKKYPSTPIPAAAVYVPVSRRRNISSVYVLRSVRPSLQHQVQIYIPTFTRRIQRQTTVVTRRMPPVITPSTIEYVPLTRFRRVYLKANQVRIRPLIPHQSQFLVPAPPRRVLQNRVDIHHRHDVPIQTNYHTPIVRRALVPERQFYPQRRSLVVEIPPIYVPAVFRRNVFLSRSFARVMPPVPFQTVIDNFVPITRTRHLYSYFQGCRRGYPFVSAITQDVVVTSRRCMR